MARRQPQRKTYHHGTLRQSCVDLGLVLLLEGGPQAVSLREVARRCRVSPRAPYQHFADKTDFLAAIAAQGFAEFGAALGDVRARLTGKPPEVRLAALAHAYVDFALARPALVQLMFGEDFGDRARRFPALHAAALATFAVLEQEVGALAPEAGPRAHRLQAAAAWALVHGLAELLRKGQLAHVLPNAADHRALPAAAVELFIRGARDV